MVLLKEIWKTSPLSHGGFINFWYILNENKKLHVTNTGRTDGLSLAHTQWHDIAYKGTTLSTFPCSFLFQNCICSLQVSFWTAKDSCSLVYDLSYLLASRKAFALCPDFAADKHRECSNLNSKEQNDGKSVPWNELISIWK